MYTSFVFLFFLLFDMPISSSVNWPFFFLIFFLSLPLLPSSFFPPFLLSFLIIFILVSLNLPSGRFSCIFQFIEKFISKTLKFFKCFCFLNIINLCSFFFLNVISSNTINWFVINIFPGSCRLFKTMMRKKIHKSETLKKVSDFKILLKISFQLYY